MHSNVHEIEEVIKVCAALKQLASITLTVVFLSVQAAMAKNYPVRFAPPYWTEDDRQLAKEVGIDKPDFLVIEKLTGSHPSNLDLLSGSTKLKGMEMPLADWCVNRQSAPKLLAARCNPQEVVLSLRSALAKKPYLIFVRTGRYKKGGRDPFLCVFPGSDPYRVLRLYVEQIRREDRGNWEYLSRTDNAQFLQSKQRADRLFLSNAEYDRLQAKLKEWEA
jgi:hypothetical protein